MTEPTRRPPSTPKGLNIAGRRVWKRIVSAYLLRPDELFLLESACRIADLVQMLDDSMAGQPLMVKGSMGQMREHPLLSEARQQRALFARHMAQLKLPEEGTLSGGSSWKPALGDRSIQARNAAQSRWSRGAG